MLKILEVILVTGYTPDVAAPEDLKWICGLLANQFTQEQLEEVVLKCLESAGAPDMRSNRSQPPVVFGKTDDVGRTIRQAAIHWR